MKKVNQGFNSILGQTNKVIESSKLKIEINKYKTKINVIYKEIGEIAFQEFKKGEKSILFSSEYIDTKIKEIEFYLSKIKEMENK